MKKNPLYVVLKTNKNPHSFGLEYKYIAKEDFMNQNKLKQKAVKALYFLEEHPAIAPNQLHGRYLYFSIQDVCKRGYDKMVRNMGVDIWPTSPNASMFKEEFEKEYRRVEKDYKNKPSKILKAEKRFVKIEVPYKKLFGELWKYNRTEYWGEMSFAVYHGNPKKEMKDVTPYTWQSYDAGINTSALSYEELVIKMANVFKKRFGNFERDYFLTPEEKRNHKKNEIFFQVKEKGSPFTRLKRNPAWIRVPDAELNHRWCRWFLLTPYGKKHWGDSKELKKIIKISSL